MKAKAIQYSAYGYWRQPTLSLTMLVADGPEAFSPLDRCQGFTEISGRDSLDLVFDRGLQ